MIKASTKNPDFEVGYGVPDACLLVNSVGKEGSVNTKISDLERWIGEFCAKFDEGTRLINNILDNIRPK